MIIRRHDSHGSRSRRGFDRRAERVSEGGLEKGTHGSSIKGRAGEARGVGACRRTSYFKSCKASILCTESGVVHTLEKMGQVHESSFEDLAIETGLPVGGLASWAQA